MPAQQRKLNAFVKEYNELRPHEALNMKTPASVHKLSIREYPERIDEWVYQKEFKVRYVCRNGAIRIGKSSWLFVSTAFKGTHVGLEELGSGIYRLYYRDFFIGYLDEKERKVHDIQDYHYELKV